MRSRICEYALDYCGTHCSLYRFSEQVYSNTYVDCFYAYKFEWGGGNSPSSPYVENTLTATTKQIRMTTLYLYESLPCWRLHVVSTHIISSSLAEWSRRRRRSRCCAMWTRSAVQPTSRSWGRWSRAWKSMSSRATFSISATPKGEWDMSLIPVYVPGEIEQNERFWFGGGRVGGLYLIIPRYHY